MAWLAQRPVLVPGSIRDNLELFGPLADLDSACRAAGFDEVLAVLPDGLDTVIGRGGVGLSLGQRQRLGPGQGARLAGAACCCSTSRRRTWMRAWNPASCSAIVARARAGATVLVVGHREPVLAIGDRVVASWGALSMRELLRPRLPRLLLAVAAGVCCRWAARWRWPGSRRG